MLWQVDCPNWHIEPHGNGETCTLYIHTLPTVPVSLHATAINRCDTVRRDFTIRASYFVLPEEKERPAFDVSPNPTNGDVVLRFGDMNGKAEVEVYNSLGQKTDAFSVDLSSSKEMGYVMPDHNNGLYIFVLKNNGRTFTRKVAVVR